TPQPHPPPTDELESAKQLQTPGSMHASRRARSLSAAPERMRKSTTASTAKIQRTSPLYQQLSAITCSTPTALSWKPRNIRLKKQRKSLIMDAFAKAGEIDAVRQSVKEQETLRAVINQKAALEALVQLVAVRNLPYNCSSWPELHAFISAINYTAEDLISLSHGSIQKLVSNSFCVHKDILRKKLQSSPSKIHLSADVWSAPNHKAFLGTCVKFVDLDSKETLQALLALSELPGLDGPGSHGGAEQWKLLHHVLEDYNI
ncbi:transposase-like protein, partial [Macrophomina phaseolina MS6]